MWPKTRHIRGEICECVLGALVVVQVQGRGKEQGVRMVPQPLSRGVLHSILFTQPHLNLVTTRI